LATESDWLSQFLKALLEAAGSAPAPAALAPPAVPPDAVAAPVEAPLEAPIAAPGPAEPPVEVPVVPAPPALTPAPAPTLATPVVRTAPVLPAASALALLITPTLLHRLGVRDPDPWMPPILAACGAHEINNPPRVAAFFANVMIETRYLSQLVESLNYTPQALVNTWPTHFSQALAQALGRTDAHPANQPRIGEVAYGGRLGNGPPGSGDGYLFRGRGLIQLTGRDNYTRFAGRIGVTVDALVALLSQPDTAAESAGHFWQAAGCNQLADRKDIVAVRVAVNGGTNGLPDVETVYRRACALLSV
jgi:putative chitinase